MPATPTPVSSRWVSAQKATPSFANSEGGALSALDRPLPASLAPYDAVADAPQPAAGRSPRLTVGTSPRRVVGSPSRARTPPARKPIHEDLIERGKLYTQRKEALQEKALKNELARCRSVPKVSPMARVLERSEPIVSRLYKLENEKRKMNEFKQMELDRRDDLIMKELFKPTLSRRGQRTQGRSMRSQHELWEYKREQRIHEQRLAQIAREMAGVQGAPEINPRSEALAAKRREAEGLGGYTHFEAMLERDRLAKLAQWEREQLRQQAENPFTPRITEMAARMHSNMNVVDRLVARGEEREARQRAANERDERQWQSDHHQHSSTHPRPRPRLPPSQQRTTAERRPKSTRVTCTSATWSLPAAATRALTRSGRRRKCGTNPRSIPRPLRSPHA
jgi:hypothetical protein